MDSSPQGKDSDRTTAHVKNMSMECKVTEKNMDKLLSDGQVDGDLGMNVPHSGGVMVKQEAVDDDVQPLREALADLKFTYLVPAKKV